MKFTSEVIILEMLEFEEHEKRALSDTFTPFLVKVSCNDYEARTIFSEG